MFKLLDKHESPLLLSTPTDPTLSIRSEVKYNTKNTRQGGWWMATQNMKMLLKVWRIWGSLFDKDHSVNNLYQYGFGEDTFSKVWLFA